MTTCGSRLSCMDRCPDCDHKLELHTPAGSPRPTSGHDKGGCWELMTHQGGRFSTVTCFCITAYIDGRVDRESNQSYFQETNARVPQT